MSDIHLTYAPMLTGDGWEWFCPLCSYHISVNTCNPAKRLVLHDRGDESARHIEGERQYIAPELDVFAEYLDNLKWAT